MESNAKSTKLLAVLWVAGGSLARLLPHLPNVTPTVSVSLFAGKQLDRAKALISVIAMMLVSDVLLAKLHGHEIFGYWSLFTYTGMLAIVLAGRRLAHKFTAVRAFAMTLLASVGFWVWTNFGTWLTSEMYTLDSLGLTQCFLSAIPFLGYSLIGDLAWMLLLFFSYQAACKFAGRDATGEGLRASATRG